MADLDKMARELVDATPMPALIGTLADLKDYQKNVVVAYGKACARIAARAALLAAPPGWKLVPEVSKTTAALIDLLAKRDQAGRAKYGTTLDRTDLTHDEWLQHMAEELLDGAGYALAAKRCDEQEVGHD